VLPPNLRPFYIAIPDPSFDGTNPKMRDPTADRGVGVIEFKSVTRVRFGSSHDEVLSGHSLWGSGQEFYHAHLVENSPWIQEPGTPRRSHRRRLGNERSGDGVGRRETFIPEEATIAPELAETAVAAVMN